MAIDIKTVTGPDMAAYLPDLARLRTEVFRAWPYLYDGQPDKDGEFNDYASGSGAAFIVAVADGAVVGISTCGPLVNEPAKFQEPFAAAGIDPATHFYFGESVLQRAYRGQGVGVAFFAAREAQARLVGGFTHASFCSVRRAADDPRRPADAVPLDSFWRKRGYAPLDGVACSMTWPEIGNPTPVVNILDVWAKRL